MDILRHDGSSRRVYLTLVASMLVLMGAMVYILYSGTRMNLRHVPLVDATMEIRLSLTKAHLWFEEVLGGDQNETIDDVWRHLDEADWYVQAMLEGGQNPEGTFLPVSDSQTRSDLQKVQRKLAQFRDLTTRRWDAKETSKLGTEIDQQYDDMFREISRMTDAVETKIQRLISAETRTFQWVQMLLIAGSAMVYGFVGLTFRRYSVERERAECKCEMLIDDLEGKNAELERFAYTVSHDLKSPLITVKGFLSILEKDALSGNLEQLKDDIAYIDNAANTMERLLDDLLELSRIGRLTRPSEDIPLAKLARETVQLLAEPIARRGVTVEIAPDLPSIHGDRVRFKEVLQNLIENAVKYMGDRPDPRVEIGARQDGKHTVCFVRDNGMGIDLAYQDKVFGLFNQLDQSVDGTGIGLAIVKRIVETHDGRVWVESEGEGKGSTFLFTVPRRHT